MAINTKQTELFIVKPGASPAVVKVGQVTDITGIDAPISSIESTTLDSDHRTYTPGIAEPGTASFKVLFDPTDVAQADLRAMRNAGTVLHWAVGFSDGIASPALVVGSDAFDDAALARSVAYFDGFMTTFDFGAAINGVVEFSVGLQLVNIPNMVVAA